MLILSLRVPTSIRITSSKRMNCPNRSYPTCQTFCIEHAAVPWR